MKNLLAVALMLACATSMAGDPRVCHAPADVPRDAIGRIARSVAARAAFVRLWPCPSTGDVSGSCPGWQVDHIVPLVSGGCDAVVNMQWLPVALKTCAGEQCKDRWEQRVYGVNQ